MGRIAFIGLGHMGGPMAQNLLQAGHDVIGFDLSREAIKAHQSVGGNIATSILETIQDVDVIITMLPEGRHSQTVYLGEGGVFENAPKTALLVDCSTIDIETTKRLHEEAEARGFQFLDAPVSGGVGGAKAATLTFMVGGAEANFKALTPYLEKMGKRIVHCGGNGAGQAAKICNNMVLGISMIAVSEAFNLAEKLGLSPEKFFEVASGSSAQCWSLTSYCPAPGQVPTAPSNNGYAPGFMAQMMLKDLKLATDAAESGHAYCPLGQGARDLYEKYCDAGNSAQDFSGIIQYLNGID